MQLTGKTALVTGGAVRIGRAIAERLAAEGVVVAVHCHQSRKEIEPSASGIRAVFTADFSRPETECPDLMVRVRRELGPIDFLINNAAIFEAGTLISTTAEEWERHMAINLRAPVVLSQAFANQLPLDRTGRIVNILDWRAERPCPGHLAYTVSKAGLSALTKILAAELAPRIFVNAVAPGAILPPASTDFAAQTQIAGRNRLGRFGSPDDVAEAVVFLLKSEFITGDTLAVSGGEQL